MVKVYSQRRIRNTVDWYDQQTLGLDNSTVYWKNIAPRPGTSQYASARSGKNDEMHVVVVDDNGSVSGVSGNILEKFTNLSKGSDARITPSQNIYYKNYIENNSNYLFAGATDSLSQSPSIHISMGGLSQLRLRISHGDKKQVEPPSVFLEIRHTPLIMVQTMVQLMDLNQHLQM